MCTQTGTDVAAIFRFWPDYSIFVAQIDYSKKKSKSKLYVSRETLDKKNYKFKIKLFFIVIAFILKNFRNVQLFFYLKNCDVYY